MAILAKDLYSTPGKEVLREVIKRQYDVDIDLSKVHIEIAPPTPDYPATMRKAVISALVGDGYHGTTWFDYKPVPLDTFQLDQRFVIEGTLPIRVGQIVDEMELRYGILIELHDLAENDTLIVANTYGQQYVPVYKRSIRFSGEWQFEFVPPNSSLSQLIPPTSAASVVDVLVE